MTTDRKDRKASKGRFAKGASGNPAGRPPGSRNHATLLMEAMLEREGEQLLRKAIEMASGGDLHALRLCLERLLPARKDRAIHLSLPPIKDAQQISDAMAVVVEAIGEGTITPREGETLANILLVQTNVLTTGDLERRVEQLEQARLEEQEEQIEPESSDMVHQPPDARTPSDGTS